MKTIKTLLFIGLTTAVLIIAMFFFLNFYTHHDKALTEVPDLDGIRVDKALRILEDGGFQYVITDTIYRDGKPLLSIIDQNPSAGEEVKHGRIIYLKLNSKEVPDVEMPALAGKTSYKQAVRLLGNRGLDIGTKIKRPDPHIKDPDSEPVLEQRLHGDSTAISPGTKLKRHTRIDLVVGVMIEAPIADSTGGSGDGVQELISDDSHL